MINAAPHWSFAVLGPTAITLGAGSVHIPATKPRTLALLLLTSANHPVSVATMIDEIWPDRPPASALANVRTYLSQLKRLMPGRLTAEPGGYRFEVRPGELDLAEFTTLVTAGRADARRRPDAAMTGLGAALRLWRGLPFTGEAAGPILQARAAAAADERLTAAETFGELLLRAGDTATAQVLFRDLVREHPLRERLRALLMVAVYRGGDPAEALAGYREARAALADELGLDPGPELAEIHQAVLRRDERLLAADPGMGDRLSVPFQTPPAVADFVGREAEVARLTQLLRERSSAASGACTAVVINGMAGAGKSTLAVWLAHHVADAYPDGALYADLRHADGAAVPPEEILGRFLRALGTPEEALPREAGERAGLFRSLLVNRRMLVVADDAADENQVRQLLPSAGSALLVTARTVLAVPGAALVTLGPLSAGDGIALLGRIVGTPLVSAEPEAAATIVELCGGLPLGVRAAGIRVATTRQPSLHRAAARLADEHERLDRLSIGDIDIRASLALTYRQVHPQALALLRMMSAVPVQTFAAWLPAVLLGVSEPTAETMAERLCDAQILQRTGADRFMIHDLVRLSANDGPADMIAEAGQAVLRAALTANLRLPGRPMPMPVPDDPLPSAGVAPVEWFESEIDSVRALVPRLATAGHADLAAQLAAAVANFCVLRGRLDDWQAVNAAIPSDAALTTPTAALLALSSGNLHRVRDDNAAALPYLRLAYRLYQRVADTRGMVAATHGWSVAAFTLNRPRVARAVWQRAAELAVTLGGGPAAGHVLLVFREPLAWSPTAEQAALEGALEIFEATNEPWAAAEAHMFLADNYRRRQQPAVAARHARAAMSQYAELRDHAQLTVAELVLANVHLQLGSAAHARFLGERSLARAERLRHRWCTASARRTIARAELMAGRPAAAIPLLEAALHEFGEMGLRASAEATRTLLTDTVKLASQPSPR